VIIVYGINLSTFTRKVRLALAEKDIPSRLEVAPMGSARVKAMHPLGQVPVIEDRGVVIPDSSVIIAYLERAYPQRPLYPGAATDLARALWLEEYADTRLRQATVPFFAERVVKPVFQARPPDEAALAAAAPLFLECGDYLERELGERGFFVGDALTVADVAVGAQYVTGQQGGAAVDAARWPRLAAWLDRLRHRPAWAAILAEEEESLAAARARSRR
jgi:glutathione S-transferase